jgi:hypothetical protein
VLRLPADPAAFAAAAEALAGAGFQGAVERTGLGRLIGLARVALTLVQGAWPEGEGQFQL